MKDILLGFAQHKNAEQKVKTRKSFSQSPLHSHFSLTCDKKIYRMETTSGCEVYVYFSHILSLLRGSPWAGKRERSHLSVTVVTLECRRSVLTPVLDLLGALISPQCPTLYNLSLGLCLPLSSPCAASWDAAPLHGSCPSPSPASLPGILLVSTMQCWHHHRLEGYYESHANDSQGLRCPIGDADGSPSCATVVCTLKDKKTLLNK